MTVYQMTVKCADLDHTEETLFGIEVDSLCQSVPEVAIKQSLLNLLYENPDCKGSLEEEWGTISNISYVESSGLISYTVEDPLLGKLEFVGNIEIIEE